MDPEINERMLRSEQIRMLQSCNFNHAVILIKLRDKTWSVTLSGMCIDREVKVRTFQQMFEQKLPHFCFHISSRLIWAWETSKT